MAKQEQEYRQFKGLVPLIDRRRIEDPYVVDGDNFLVDADGPLSAFARSWILQHAIDEPRAYQTLKTIDEQDTYHFASNAILRYDVDSRQFYPVYVHTARVAFYPWTRAVCGGVLYLCNPEVGIVYYNSVTGYWGLLTGANVPTTPYAICESYGRLVILSLSYVTWSAIDDGTNSGLAPSTVTGAGSQGLSILASKATPLMILPFEGGVLAYCKQGILRGEFVQATNPFRWFTISREHSLLNPWAICLYGDVDHQAHVFLTHRGLFLTRGERPEMFEAAMSEHLHTNVLKSIAHNNTEFTTALQYDPNIGWLVVSIAFDSRERFYNGAYVLYQPSGEWGYTSRTHTCVTPVALNSGAFADMWYGMCDSEGTVWRFTREDSDEGYPVSDDWQIDLTTYFDLPSIFNGTTGVFSDLGVLSDEDLTFPTGAGVWNTRYELSEYLDPASDLTVPSEAVEVGPPDTYVSSASMEDSMVVIVCALLYSTSQPLDAWIQIGPIRIKQESYGNMITQMQGAIIGSDSAGSADSLEDFLLDYDQEVLEDWSVLIALEDWGATAGDHSEYSVVFEGTLDGYTPWAANGYTQSVIPDLIRQKGQAKYLAGVVSGQYCYVFITAYNLGEVFHIKHMRTALLNAGRLD